MAERKSWNCRLEARSCDHGRSCHGPVGEPDRDGATARFLGALAHLRVALVGQHRLDLELIVVNLGGALGEVSRGKKGLEGLDGEYHLLGAVQVLGPHVVLDVLLDLEGAALDRLKLVSARPSSRRAVPPSRLAGTGWGARGWRRGAQR